MAQGAAARKVRGNLATKNVSSEKTGRAGSGKGAIRANDTAKKSSPSGHLSELERNQLIEENVDLAYRLAWKFLHHWRIRLFEDEVRSIVGLALCEAALRFNRDFNTSFRTFLFYHLRGCLLKEISEKIKLSHSRRSLVAALIESDEDKKTIDAEELSFVERFTPEAALLEKQTNQVCWQATQKLDELEQQVLLRHFVDEESLNQIAEDLGYCRCHISRVKHKALEKMERLLRPILDSGKPEDEELSTRSKVMELRRYTGGRGRRKIASPVEPHVGKERAARQKVAA